MESQATTQPRVLILGHSFVRRMKDFLCQNHVEKECRMDFKLRKLCVVTLLGIGGRTIDKLIRFDLEKIRKTTPTILVLEMGSNDLCDLSCDPQTICQAIMAFTELLAFELNIHHTVICKVIARKKPPFPDYNQRVKELNTALHYAVGMGRHVTLWHHRGLSNPEREIYAPDGIHLNISGNKLLYKSYRGAILFAVKQAEQSSQ